MSLKDFKIHLILFFAFLGLFCLFFQVGASSDVSYEEAVAFAEGFHELIEGTDGLGIFANNSVGALPMFVPGFGIAWGLYTAWSTGFAFAAIVSTIPGLEEIQPLSILFLSPFGLMELVAYSIALYTSFHIVYLIIKRPITGSKIISTLKSQVKPSAIKVGIVLALLLAGGFLEEYMIRLAQQ